MSQKRIFLFWLPLFASWLLMTMEAPIIHTAITRLPLPLISLAAFGIVMALSVTIESPVIMLLATSTALASNRQAYLVLRRFTWHLNLALTVVAALVAFVDPLYAWLVPGIMNIPPEIAAAAQAGMKIMVFWTAAIGWRRFNQGILIRFGYTRRVTYGTIVRLVFSVSVAFAAGWLLRLPGVWAGSIGLMSGVTSEALFIHWMARDVKATHYQTTSEPEDAPLTYKAVVKFHTPLGATSVMALLAQPLIGAGLARMAYPKASLAVWPVIFGLLLIARSGAFALPEVVITLSNGRDAFKAIRNFCFGIGVIAALLMAFATITPITQMYLSKVTGLTDDLVEIAVPALILSILLPFFTAIQNWLRGLLMKNRTTNLIYIGMAINLIVTAIILYLGVFLQTSGISTAAIALSVATLVEALFLWRQMLPKIRLLTQPVQESAVGV